MLRYIHKTVHHHYRTRYHGVYSHAKQLFVFDLALLGLALFFFGASIFFFLWKPGIIDLIDVTVSLGDARLKSGQTADVAITYTNRSKQNLQNLSLAIRLPPGFIVNRDETPKNELSLEGVVKLSDLSAGAVGTFVIHGWLWSEPEHDDKILAALSYRPDNSSAREQQIGIFIARLPESVLVGRLTMVTSSFARQTIPFVYTLTNTSERTLNNVAVTYDWPNTIPELKKLSALSLAPGGAVTVSGTVAIPANKPETILRVTPSITINKRQIRQGVATQTIAIFQPNLVSTARFITNARFAEGGSQLPLELHWENHSAKTATSLRLRLHPTAGTIDLKTTAFENNLKIDGQDLIVDKNTRTALANRENGGSDTFIINVTFLPSLKNAPSDANSFDIIPIMEADFAEIPGEVFTDAGSAASLPLATELNLSTTARYYTSEGDQLGRGPLPPKLAETTKYWLFIEVENTANPITNVAFSATLAPGVSFTGEQSVTIGQSVSVDSVNHNVSWNFAELPSHSHTGLYFEVAVTPGPKDISRTITLLKNISWTATDSVTGKNLTTTKAAVTNVLNSNDRGSRLGAVVVP
ncbi:MAG: hypothetical protein EXS55_03430 [Candidatus Magasanikbacteria bacterium]|nr:hypothetical protein [Candidatus Magasanikbacteria bacterium]